MTMKYLIGLDIGTSAVKGALMDSDTRIVCTQTAPFTYFEEGTAKLLDPEHFVDTCKSVIRELAAKAAADAENCQLSTHVF